jgi:hypothetical protein
MTRRIIWQSFSSIDRCTQLWLASTSMSFDEAKAGHGPAAYIYNRRFGYALP